MTELEQLRQAVGSLQGQLKSTQLTLGRYAAENAILAEHNNKLNFELQKCRAADQDPDVADQDQADADPVVTDQDGGDPEPALDNGR